MRARYVIEQLCEAESALQGTLFLNSSNDNSWLPSPIYIPEKGDKANEEFVNRWSDHLGIKMKDSPTEIVSELVRRHGLVIVTSNLGDKPPNVVSLKKKLALSADNMAELDETFGLSEDQESYATVFWRPSLQGSETEVRTAVVFYGENDDVANRPDRGQRLPPRARRATSR